MSAISPPLSRRAALRLTASAAVAGSALAGTVACAQEDDSAATVDALTAHLSLARRDAAAALALMATAPERADALRVIDSERTAHADALSAEIDRVAGVAPGTSTATPTADATSPQSPPPTVDELRTFLNESQRDAADSARNESGYRAGLLGSISAACAVHSTLVPA